MYTREEMRNYDKSISHTNCELKILNTTTMGHVQFECIMKEEVRKDKHMFQENVSLLWKFWWDL
jgi:hypothetical protein